MTDTAPAPSPVLVSRTAPPSQSTALSAEHQGMELELRYARTMADAAQALPSAYRKQPGAILLAREWARSRGVDTLTAIQTVAFIDGRPTVDATMQRALAERAGYTISLVDIGDESATAVVSKDGAELGRTTYTWADAEKAGLAGKQNYRQNPKAMMVARATTQALKWYAPSVTVGIYDPDELPATDVTDLVELPTPPSVETEPDPVVVEEPEQEIHDAEIITTNTIPADAAEWKALGRANGVTYVDMLKHTNVTYLTDLDPIAADQLVTWIQNGGRE